VTSKEYMLCTQKQQHTPYELTPVRTLVTTTAPMTIMMVTMKLVMKAMKPNTR